MTSEEHNQQATLFAWARAMENEYPELRLLFAVPNAGKRTVRQNAKGQWYSSGGQWMKAEGLKKGVPDIWFPVARLEYHGLVIEMKSLKGTLSHEQKQWLDMLNEQRYLTAVCRSWVDAANLIMRYLIGDAWKLIE